MPSARVPIRQVSARHRRALTLLLLSLGLGCARSGAPGASMEMHGAAVRIAPEAPTVMSELSAELGDGFRDPAQCRFVWSVNGQVLAQQTGRVLAPDQFRKGDQVAVEVTAPASGSSEAVSAGAQATVGDAVPVVRAVRVALDGDQGGATMTASADIWDADGDPISLRYRWFRNGREIPGEQGASLSTNALGKGDRVEVEVVATGATGASAPLRSASLALDNRAPRFAADAAQSRIENGVLLVKLNAMDPDGDAITYELEQGPAGMTIDPAGTITWRIPPVGARPASVEVRVRATDGRGGAATQPFGIGLETAATTAAH